MKYMLILSLLNSGVHTVPQVYPTKEACEQAGEQWEKVVGTDAAARHLCTPWYDYRGQ